MVTLGRTVNLPAFRVANWFKTWWVPYIYSIHRLAIHIFGISMHIFGVHMHGLRNEHMMR